MYFNEPERVYIIIASLSTTKLAYQKHLIMVGLNTSLSKKVVLITGKALMLSISPAESLF